MILSCGVPAQVGLTVAFFGLLIDGGKAIGCFWEGVVRPVPVSVHHFVSPLAFGSFPAASNRWPVSSNAARTAVSPTSAYTPAVTVVDRCPSPFAMTAIDAPPASACVASVRRRSRSWTSGIPARRRIGQNGQVSRRAHLPQPQRTGNRNSRLLADFSLWPFRHGLFSPFHTSIQTSPSLVGAQHPPGARSTLSSASGCGREARPLRPGVRPRSPGAMQRYFAK